LELLDEIVFAEPVDQSPAPSARVYMSRIARMSLDDLPT
jgi:hypothetical protein